MKLTSRIFYWVCASLETFGTLSIWMCWAWQIRLYPTVHYLCDRWSIQRGNTIAFLIKNSFARGRQSSDTLFENNGDKTGMNRYPVQSGVDVFQNEEFIENYDYTKFKIEEADYILLKDDNLRDYAVAIVNPFK